MSERSLLRVRPQPHIDPSRKKDEFIVEVWREGEVVATIYGSREGIHILSDRLRYEDGRNQPFSLTVNDEPGMIVPLLAEGEKCPWCEGTGAHPPELGMCPVCHKA